VSEFEPQLRAFAGRFGPGRIAKNRFFILRCNMTSGPFCQPFDRPQFHCGGTGPALRRPFQGEPIRQLSASHEKIQLQVVPIIAGEVNRSHRPGRLCSGSDRFSRKSQDRCRERPATYRPGRESEEFARSGLIFVAFSPDCAVPGPTENQPSKILPLPRCAALCDVLANARFSGRSRRFRGRAS